MTTLVIDASIAVKWVVEEADTADALAIRGLGRLIAPDLLVAECANILWKKVLRGEFSLEEADLAARVLQAAEVELLPTRGLLSAATRMAIELNHPAYDCFYLATAAENQCQFVTADERLLRKIAQRPRNPRLDRAISLAAAAARSRRMAP